MRSTRKRRRSWAALAAFALAPIAAATALAVGFDPVSWQARLPLVHRLGEFAGAESCVPCHPAQHATWHRTFHRTMTQWATADTVVGAFDGRPVRYAGRTARPYRRGDRFFIEVPEPAGSREAEVVLTVGSRRYQQYFEKVEHEDGFVFVRLPILWHIEDARWLHLNTVFLAPDDPDWDRHRSRWNDNCIFCHNTGPRPGEIDFGMAESNDARRFDSRVAQLGIGCEACHGPGLAHLDRYDNPLRRYADYLSRDNRTEIVNPESLDKDRAVSVCGQCHGQRVPLQPDDVVRWLTAGPTYRSGERLAEHVRPLDRDTPSIVEGAPDLFRKRFWADGTPRLTAYEYQGVTNSPCYQRGAMTCESCHTMHGGDPRGMIEPEMRGDAACTPCHRDIAADVAGHTHHEAAGSGSRCMECHMPRMVYGILGIHRSHRIENPDPARDGETGRPHACTTCHLDRSLDWSADKMAEWWGERYRRPARRLDGAPTSMPDALASLLAGDPVQRAVYAWAAGRSDADVKPHDKAFLRGALTAVLVDSYPGVRRLAWRSLLSLERELPLGIEAQLAAWDTTDADSRHGFAARMFDELARRAPARLNAPHAGFLMRGDWRPDVEAMNSLLALQDNKAISIGE